MTAGRQQRARRRHRRKTGLVSRALSTPVEDEPFVVAPIHFGRSQSSKRKACPEVGILRIQRRRRKALETLAHGGGYTNTSRAAFLGGKKRSTMRVVLVTSQPVFTLGFRSLVESARDVELVAEAGDARSGFRAIDAHKPDVLVIDLALPGMNGIHALPEVRRRASRTRVLMVADWARERDVLEALSAGAHGFASKSDGTEELLGAIRAVAAGQSYVAPAFHRFVGLEPARLTRSSARAPVDVLKVLSPREREVLDLVVRGWRNRAIARSCACRPRRWTPTARASTASWGATAPRS